VLASHHDADAPLRQSFTDATSTIDHMISIDDDHRHALFRISEASGIGLGALLLPVDARAAFDAAEVLPWHAFGLLLVGALLALSVLLGLLAWQQRQRRDAAALRDERARVRRLLGLIEGPLWRTDAQHRLTALRATALPADHALHAGRDSQAFWQLFDETSMPGLRQALESEADFQAIEVGLAAPGGGPLQRWRLKACVCLDASGRFAGHEGSATLLTPPRPSPAGADEDAASFGTLVSHDLRAPIRVVEGFTKIVKEDYGRLLDRVGNDHLDRVLGAAARMNGMIDALLALSRLGALPLARQTVDLSQLASYVIDDLQRQAPERRVDVRIAPGLLVTGDPTLLRVVLENLLGNAWKYSAHRHVARIELGRVVEGEHSAFCVADNGAGFDMRFIDRLFGVFQRLHSSSDFAGTGVGLASVRRIVQRHGGEIWAEAEVDRGARFYFTLST